MTIQFDIPVDQIKIYGAGKTWAASDLKALRDKGYNIISRWIDAAAVLKSPDDKVSPEIHNNEALKRQIWEFGCKQDCLSCDFMYWITRPIDGNLHSGAIAELGHVTAFNKPVYIIGTCESVEPVDNSDRAWKSQSMVYHWPKITDPEQGIIAAIKHYKENYVAQWLERNKHNLTLRA